MFLHAKMPVSDRPMTVSMAWQWTGDGHPRYYIHAKRYRGVWFGKVHNMHRCWSAPVSYSLIATLWTHGVLKTDTRPDWGRTYKQRETEC